MIAIRRIVRGRKAAWQTSASSTIEIRVEAQAKETASHPSLALQASRDTTRQLKIDEARVRYYVSVNSNVQFAARVPATKSSHAWRVRYRRPSRAKPISRALGFGDFPTAESPVRDRLDMQIGMNNTQ
jgi:hypothetical protein